MPDDKILSFENKLFFNNTQLISKEDTKFVDYYNIIGQKTFSSSSAGQITTLPSYINTMYIISLQIDAQVTSSNTVGLYFTDINLAFSQIHHILSCIMSIICGVY